MLFSFGDVATFGCFKQNTLSLTCCKNLNLHMNSVCHYLRSNLTVYYYVTNRLSFCNSKLAYWKRQGILYLFIKNFLWAYKTAVEFFMYQHSLSTVFNRFCTFKSLVWWYKNSKYGKCEESALLLLSTRNVFGWYGTYNQHKDLSRYVVAEILETKMTRIVTALVKMKNGLRCIIMKGYLFVIQHMKCSYNSFLLLFMRTCHQVKIDAPRQKSWCA